MEEQNIINKQEKLFKILKIIKDIQFNKWWVVNWINDNYSSIKIIDKTWNDRFRQDDELDLSKIETWSTYDSCFEFRFSINDKNQLHCFSQIFDGGLLYGERKKLRFTTNLIFPDHFILHLDHEINFQFNRHLEKEYECFLLEQKRNWCDNKRKELLK